MPLDSIKQQDAEFIEVKQTWGNQMDSPRKTGDKKRAILVRFHGDWIGLHRHKMVAWSAQGQDRAECGHAISSLLLQTLLAITTAIYPVFDVGGVPPPTLHQEYGYGDILCRAWFPAVYLQCVAQSYRWILSCVYRPKTTCVSTSLIVPLNKFVMMNTHRDRWVCLCLASISDARKHGVHRAASEALWVLRKLVGWRCFETYERDHAMGYLMLGARIRYG